ncbi:MAG: hypothetical protein ABI551_07090, partial [Polyangiaceae bacterium]
DGTKAAQLGGFGHGVLAFESGSLTLDHVTIRKSAAVGVLVGGASATISSCRVIDNAVGINVQDGTTLQEPESVPQSPTELVVDVSKDTVFSGNDTRVGSEQLPIPTDLQ